MYATHVVGWKYAIPGKMDIYDNTKIDLLPFRKNIAFFAVDLDSMKATDPELVDEITQEALVKAREGSYKVSPSEEAHWPHL